MEGLKLIPYIALILTIAGIILGASVITISEFGSTMTTCFNESNWTLNAAGSACTLPTTGTNLNSSSATPQGENGLNLSNEYFTNVQSIEGLGNVAEQQPTIAIIAVMVIIISIIAGVFVYMRYFA